MTSSLDRQQIEKLEAERHAFKMQLLGALGLLASCSVMLGAPAPKADAAETRDLIEACLEDARKLIPNLKWRRLLSRIEVSVL